MKHSVVTADNPEASENIKLVKPADYSTILFRLCADLLSLTKPGVIALLLVSTACPMILAGGGSVNSALLLWTLLGGALISGSAAAINCVWERDLDRLMERTKGRPMAAGRLSPLTGMVFASVLGFLGLVILATRANPFAAAIALFGHFFYVFVYTIWLKPITPQNIVIGGAAGAVPPLVGWAAVRGELDLTAVLLFALVFLWTPPHFWALALNKNADYRRAGIPMLPVVAGERSTHLQMFSYALALLPVSVLLVLTDVALGWFSLSVMLVLGLVFAYKIYQLKVLGEEGREERVKKAWEVFGFSMIYLALFFACLVIDVTLL